MKKINLERIILHLFLLISATLISCNKMIENERPNILFIMSDDQSWLDVGIYGCEEVNTPVFDELGREGAIFSNNPLGK